MRSRYFLILSVIAVVLFIVIQTFIVRQVYMLRMDEFNFQYREVIEEGIANLTGDYTQTGFDSALIYLEDAAFRFGQVFDTITSDANRQGFGEFVYSTSLDILHEREFLTDYLRFHLVNESLDSGFQSRVRINELTILTWAETYNVIDTSTNRYVQDAMPGLRSAKALYANTYVAEGDFFSVSFDYLADYNHKAKIVLRNMLGILLVIVASVLAVMGIFFYTLWNLVKQKKVSEMQSEFINHITHELKTPLTTIAVAAESISSDSILNQPERIVSLSAIIAKQNRYLSHLINNVLDISFWGKDLILSRGVKTDLKQFIHEFLAAYRITIKEHDVIIKESVDLDGKQARIDPAQMMTALNNLLDNAVKFSEKPVIRFESNVKEGNWCVCITDNGCGIEKDDLDKIFNRFYRSNQSRDRKIKGLGLGLYNVKRIVEAHEGILELESEVGQGTTVTITIPFLQDHENTTG